MKEITRINLASLPYNIEVDAKKQLEKYCAAIEHNLGADSDAMREIEARMSELLAERGVSGEKVISSADVAALQNQLGDAKDFASEYEDDTAPAAEEEKPERRLMRDTSHRMLGGVCAGIAAYFNIDVVVVRVVAVILAVISMGITVPIYLLLWVIIPPARTAADRLQMAGKPVTLTALKHESVQPSSTAEPALLTFLRYAVAGGLLVGIIATGVLMVHIITPDYVRFISMQAPWAIALTVLAYSSGILFMMMLGLLAYALLAKKFTRAMGVALIVIMLTGLSAFAVGVFGLRGDYSRSMMQMLDDNKVSTTLDAASLVGAKDLVVDSADNVLYVDYTVAAGAPHMTLEYDKRNMTIQPKVTLVKNGNVVTLKTDTQSNGCMGGTCSPTFVKITGPELHSITSANGNISYTTDGQGSLEMTANGDSKLDVYGRKNALGEVTLTAGDNAMVTVNNAAVTAVTARYTSGHARVIVGTVQRIEVTTPTVCSSTIWQPSLMYIASPQITVNGAAVTPQSNLPCFQLQQDVDGILNVDTSN